MPKAWWELFLITIFFFLFFFCFGLFPKQIMSTQAMKSIWKLWNIIFGIRKACSNYKLLIILLLCATISTIERTGKKKERSNPLVNARNKTGFLHIMHHPRQWLLTVVVKKETS